MGFATQCSIDPPRFMVWISKANHTFGVALRAATLAVHLVSPDSGLPELFGGRTGDEIDKFARVDWSAGPGGVPVLAGASAWFAGHVEGRMDGGDHVGFLLAPLAGEVRSDEHPIQLSEASDIEPGHPA
ncbi:flavin reductase family protein [Streptacidiphilus monticola]